MADLSIWDGPDNRPSGHGQAMADPTPPWDELANSSSGHGQTMADPMRLTCPRAGNYYVDWAGVCKHFGWNPKELCGPVVMSFNASAAETHCPGGHTAGCKAHQPPKVKGKPFKLAEQQRRAAKARAERLPAAAQRREGGWQTAAWQAYQGQRPRCLSGPALPQKNNSLVEEHLSRSPFAVA